MCATASRPIPARPWHLLPARVAAGIVGVCTDIDDTLTAHGQIEPAALEALQRLQAAGLPVVAITGRPARWCAEISAAWPLSAVVAENGAVALVTGSDPAAATDPAPRRFEFAQDEATRGINAGRLAEVAQRILREIPGATLARDSPGRLTDIAIDHAEFATLDREGIERCVALMHGAGMHASVSSIHVNGWFGDHSKWTGATWMVRRLFGRDLAAEIGRWVYVGDSPNDEAMFGRFPVAVGVANLASFAESLRIWPGWITDGARGRGFAEVADRLLASGPGGNVPSMTASPP
jgi:HAD superfamily hydrolase (TIGR01484 family)